MSKNVNLFVPIDFSPFADNAFDLALLWAKKFDGIIHLYHCIDIPPRYSASISNTELEEEFAVLQQNANSLMQKYLDKARNESFPIEIIIDRGKFILSAKKYLKIHACDLIIMGSHGKSGKSEFFIGSNTQKVVRSVHFPVLIVKDPIQKLDFDKILFASSFSEKEIVSFKRFLDLILPFAPELHLLAVNTTSFFSQPSLVVYEAMEEFAKLAKPLVSHKHFYSDISIEAGIRNFSKTLQCKLIGVSNHVRHPIKRLFSGSNVEMLINHSKLPVLTIDYQKKS